MRRLIAYFGVCLLVALAPGPDNCFVLAQSAAFGAWAGLWVTAGLMCGLCVHITLAALGVATALERWPRAADVISIVGACYLFYMAWGMWGAGMGSATAEARPWWGFWLRGMILNLSNPKVILFFIAFLPRFLPDTCRRRTFGLMGLGLLFMVAAATVMGAVALAGGGLSSFLGRNPEVAVWVGRVAALAVAVIGLWVLLPAVSALRRR